MSLFSSDQLVNYGILLVMFILFYFLVRYKLDNSVDEKLHKNNKKVAKKIQMIYRQYSSEQNNQEAYERKMMQMVREREMMKRNHKSYDEEDSEDDSLQNVGGAPDGEGNYASFDDDDE